MSDVTKVVINACFGGFSLSDEATREYLTRIGADWFEETSWWGLSSQVFYIRDADAVNGKRFFSDRAIERTDPTLIAIVEEWGSRADGMCANLKVESIPKGTLYRIDEYDGYEGIETRDGIDWTLA